MLITRIKERYLRDIFDVGIVIKGVDGALQIIGAVALIFLKPETISRFVANITQYELVEDPHDKIANFLVNQSHIAASSEKFAILFLLTHGAVKLFIVIALLKNKLWAYPLGIVIFTIFGIFQIYKYFYSHSIGLLILTILDVIVIALTWHEYRYIKRAKANTSK